MRRDQGEACLGLQRVNRLVQQEARFGGSCGDVFLDGGEQCIDPVLGPTGTVIAGPTGPRTLFWYWSSTTNSLGAMAVWSVHFNGLGASGAPSKFQPLLVRAVPGGS